MKILVLAPYIYMNEIPVFAKNRTGFGIMVKDIMDSIGVNNEVYFASPNIFHGRESIEKNFTIYKHTWFDFATKGSIKYFVEGIKHASQSRKKGLKNRLRSFFYCYDKGYLNYLISRINPDIIHIHGIGELTDRYIEVCNEANIKYVITLHGLIGLNDSINVTEEERIIEKNTIIKSDFLNIPITVISTGMKERIEEVYLGRKSNNIRVITNGTWRRENNNYMEEKEDPLRYAIESEKRTGKKVIFYVGNISDNKNQMQLVKNVNSIKRKQDVVVVLFGGETDGGKVHRYVDKESLDDSVIFAGFCNNINDYWDLADLNVLISKCEGFGLSIIEGYFQGVPSVVFDDLDASNDIYFSEATMLSKRNDEDLVDTIVEALSKEWDVNKIKSVSEKFEMSYIAAMYSDLYNEVCRKD